MLTIGCEDTKDDNEDTTLEQPTSYTFPSRFVDGESSVSYTGQVVRNMLHSDLKTATDRAAEQMYISEAVLDGLYDYNDTGGSTYILYGQTPTVCEATYENISTGKNLKGKTNTAVIKGFGNLTAVTAVESWIDNIGNYYINSGDTEASYLAYTSAEGHNLSQMINKTLYGAVGASQAIGNYLAKFQESTFPENNTPREGKGYTDAEHYWDEAFGYFGAHRDFLGSQTQGTTCIDITSEHNFGWAEYARKRDENPGYSFSFRTDIFTAFVAGRTIVHNGGGQDELATHIDMIKTRWEQLTAANVVYYINKLVGTDGYLPATTETSITALSSAATNYNKYWSEMRGFVISLQYIPHNLSDASLNTIVEHVRAAPLYPGQTGFDTYKSDLETARNLLISELSLN
tara:strand:- start:14198 stop:15403 length:1206 start_codon:yes stop_codon:yes gene_type:complete